MRKKSSVHTVQDTKKRKKITHSDHNAIILNFELNMNRRGKVKETTKPIWRFTKEGMKKFSRLTENNEVLCNIWQEDLSFQKNTNYGRKNLKRYSTNALKEYIQKRENSGRQQNGCKTKQTKVEFKAVCKERQK